MIPRIVCFLCLLFFTLGAQGQEGLYKRYIDKYSSMAVEQMKKYGIPASITLAQGLFESAAGTSRLAVKGKNHFGIKCGRNWHGPYMLVNDDAPNEKFRVYKSVEHSYEDHSKFLKGSNRYAFLFKLSRTDYKGWAKGLKKAGYATNPRYASALIDIIEKYSLDDYDRKGKHHGRHHRKNKVLFEGRPVYRCNGQYYVLAEPGDTYESLASLMWTKEEDLMKYNEVDERYHLKPGDIVYLGKKEKEIDPTITYSFHTMQPGESLYSISQRYGVRLKTIQKLNRVKRSYRFKVGDQIRIRK